MTVTEYDTKFTQLSRYVEGLVKNEEERAKRFVRGLKQEIRSKLILFRLQVYVDVVETTLEVEMDMQGKHENRANDENTPKRPWYQGPSGFGHQDLLQLGDLGLMQRYKGEDGTRAEDHG